LFLLQASFLFFQLPGNLQALALLGAALGGAALATLSSRGRHVVGDWLVATAWIAPQLTYLAVYALRLRGDEAYFYILSFPLAAKLLPFQVATMLAPLLPVAAGAARLGGFGAHRLLVYLVTFPLALFLDVYAALLGFVDLLRGRSHWSRARRDNAVSEAMVPEAVRRLLPRARRQRSRRALLAFVPVAALFVVLANDVLSVGACGEVRPLLWEPLLWKPRPPVEVRLEVARRLAAPGELAVELRAVLRADEPATVSLRWDLDGKPLDSRRAEVSGSRSETVATTLPLGWEQHRADVTVSGEGLVCRRGRAFATSLVEVRGRSLLVNGEPFLLKGVIPSFSHPSLGLGLDQGLAQIGAVGANAVRFYHALGGPLRDAVARAKLMVVEQPNRSTWNEIDIRDSSDRAALTRSYREMLAGTEGFPWLLFDNLGNELEMVKASDLSTMKAVAEYMDEMVPTRRVPLSYSTYLPWMNYPDDILGLSTLDTGPTYWDKGVPLAASFRKPIYASEFGGFQAFSERLPSELRIVRMVRNWEQLQRVGALGAFVFESHDNWAQPVPLGEYNDPFKPEQPDDTRGLWDERNRPKPELATVAHLFADVEVRPLADTVAADAREVQLAVRNRRGYRLAGVTLVGDRSEHPVGDLAPGEERTVALPRADGDGAELRLEARYTSHAGLPGRSSLRVVLPVAGPRPLVLNPDFLVDEAGADRLRGRLLWSGALDAMVPAGFALYVDGRRVEAAPGRARVPVPGPYRDVAALEWSRDGVTWEPFGASRSGGGRHLMRFRLPELGGGLRILVLSGIGDEHAELRFAATGAARTLATHSYRENLVDLAGLDARSLAGDIVVDVDRRHELYIPGSILPTDRDLRVDLERPVVFAPVEVELRR
jgi:hypothetical protein